jgi:Na+-transporting methylmalonyl-CoA/oxaloacetate decarboxylase beta subunit
MTEEQIRMTLEKQLEEELLKNDINPLIGMAGMS